MGSDNQNVRVAIIGAGIGGITTAIALQTQLGFHDYTVYEMAGGVGGAWLKNTYPGCECDVPSHFYSLSTEPKFDWSMMFSGQAEIKAYWEGLVQKHNIGPRIEFHSEITRAVWDEAAQLYTITIQDARSKDTREVKAHVVISATGTFKTAKYPDIVGRHRFKGASMHTSDWNHNVDVSGKRIGLIGNGSSGVQVVAELSKDPSVRIAQFCRTPTWFLAKPQVAVPGKMKWMFQHVPFCQMLFRWLLMFLIDALYISWKDQPWGTSMRRQRERASIQMVQSLAPEKYHQDMLPKYPMGCKPNIIDPGYLASLQRSNVQLEWDPIVEITEDGIHTKSGKKHSLDIICYATGFDIEGSHSADVTGMQGRSMVDYYKEAGGPTAYLGTTTPGFPNWFKLSGPNIMPEHASIVFVEEVQVNYIVQLIRPVIQGKARSFTPKLDITRAYNERLQTQLERTVWSGGCTSWYRAGSDNRGKLFTTWPGTLAYQWWVMRKPIWEHFDTVGGEEWVRLQMNRSRMALASRVFAACAILVIVLGWGMGKSTQQSRV